MICFYEWYKSNVSQRWQFDCKFLPTRAVEFDLHQRCVSLRPYHVLQFRNNPPDPPWRSSLVWNLSMCAQPGPLKLWSTNTRYSDAFMDYVSSLQLSSQTFLFKVFGNILYHFQIISVNSSLRSFSGLHTVTSRGTVIHSFGIIYSSVVTYIKECLLMKVLAALTLTKDYITVV